METLVLWVLMVTGPDLMPRPLAEFVDQKVCQQEKAKHDMMGLSEFKYSCQERHRAIFRPPHYRKSNGSISP
jgi:hypothetical protein